MFDEEQHSETYCHHWRPMVKVQEEWCGNGLVFESKQEAESNARNLMSRWMLVTDYRADPTNDPVNFKWAGNRLIPV